MAARLPPRGDPHEVPLGRVLAAMPGAAMRAAVARLPESVWRFLIALCTIVLLLAPLLLWVSWSRSGYLFILLGAAVAMVIAFTLLHFASEHRRL